MNLLPRRTWQMCIFCFVLIISLDLVHPGFAATQSQNVNNIINTTFLSDNVRAERAYGQLPMYFEANQGQVDDSVRFLSRGSGYTLFLTPDQAAFSLHQPVQIETDFPDLASRVQTMPALHSQILSMILLGSNPTPETVGEERLPGMSNYFIGSDPDQWVTDVPQYARVRYHNVYSGVDLVYYGNQQQLQYDFIVAPGADPSLIRLSFAPAEQIELDENGDLLVHLAGGVVRQQAPFTYQEINGDQIEVASHFVLLENQEVGFEIRSYDPALPLVIDPTLIYSTYLGGNYLEIADDIAVDSTGAAYIVGQTQSSNFPTTAGAWDQIYNGSSGNGDAFITKLDPTGTALVYSTYIGGSSGEAGYDIAIDATGAAVITGATWSFDFPTTPGAYDTTLSSADGAFVLKLNPSGNALLYSTLVEGSGGDGGTAIALDNTGAAYISGPTTSANFPCTPGAFDTTLSGAWDYFVFKLNPSGSALVYSTYIGGSGTQDAIYKIAVDNSGYAYITGTALSLDFPVTPGAYNTTRVGSSDAFIMKLNLTGTGLIYSTFLGGSNGESANSIAVNASGEAFVTGDTVSADFPTTPGAYDTSLSGISDDFVTRLNTTGTALIYSTLIGGSSYEEAADIVLDSSNNAYIVGRSYSTNFPVLNPYQSTNQGNYDVIVFELNSLGSALIYSTYLGGSDTDDGYGIALDSQNNTYICGATWSTNYPVQNPFQPVRQYWPDGFVSKLGAMATGTVQFTTVGGGTVAENAGTYSAQVALTVTGSGVLPSSVTVNVTLTGTATPGTDYTPAGPTIPVTFTSAGGFTPGTYFQNVTLNLIDDTLIEPIETATLTLSNPSAGTTLGIITVHTVNITDNDVVGSIQFTSIGGGTVAENVGTYTAEVTLTVTGSGVLLSPVTANITLSGTATPGTDYTPAGPTFPVTFTNAGGFAPGTYVQNVTLSLIDDTLIELTENATLTLSNPSAGTILGVNTIHSVNITDNDVVSSIQFTTTGGGTVVESSGVYNAEITLTVTGSGILPSPVTVNATLGGTATASTDYTPAGPTIPVTFTNAAGFAPGTYIQNVSLNLIDDTVVEPTEAVILTLTNPSAGTALGLNTIHTVNITDNDAGGSVEFTITNGGTIAESVGSYSAEITLTVTGSVSLPSPVTVDVILSGAAIPGTDYIPAGPTLSVTFTSVGGFAAGIYTQNITLTVIDDTLVEPTEDVTLSLNNPSTSTTLGTNTQHTVNIADNDAQSNVQFVTSSGTIAEDGGTYSINIALTVTGSAVLTSPITVELMLSGTTAPGTDYMPVGAIIPVTFTNTSGFAPGSYTQTVILAVIDDTLVEGDESVVLTLVSSTDPSVIIGSNAIHTVTILDNDITPIEPSVPTSTSQPQIGVFDPAISKIGNLAPGGLGLPGEQITWTITVTNNGSAGATNITVTDTLSSEQRIESEHITHGTVSVVGQTIIFSLDSLGPGETVEMEIVTTILTSPLGGVITNTAVLNSGEVSKTATTVINVVVGLPNTGYVPQ